MERLSVLGPRGGFSGVSVATKFDPHEACICKTFQRGE